MAEYVYVDNSNLFIEGKRFAAVQNGLAASLHDAVKQQILDNSFRLDFGKLLDFVAGNDPQLIAKAYLYGSRPPENDAIWDIAEKVGFQPVVVDRNIANKEKKVDTALVSQVMMDALSVGDINNDTFTIVAGDGDYVPPVNQLVGLGYQVDVVFWSNASKELKAACSSFVELDSHYAAIKA